MTEISFLPRSKFKSLWTLAKLECDCRSEWKIHHVSWDRSQRMPSRIDLNNVCTKISSTEMTDNHWSPDLTAFFLVRSSYFRTAIGYNPRNLFQPAWEQSRSLWTTCNICSSIFLRNSKIMFPQQPLAPNPCNTCSSAFLSCSSLFFRNSPWLWTLRTHSYLIYRWRPV